MQFLRNEVINIYTIDLFKNCGLTINWSDIYWGIKKSLLDIKTVSKFAEDLIINNLYSNIDEIYELAWETEDGEIVLELIKSILKKIPLQYNQDNETSMRRWRYCIVKTLRDYEVNSSVLLDKIEIVYADFNYPIEMSGFIRYMPPDDDYNPSNYSVKENEQHLINKIDNFIKCEWNKINSQ